MIHGLLEVNVSRARAYLRDHKANTGESLSFAAFLITCLARAVDENKAVYGRQRLQKACIKEIVTTLWQRGPRQGRFRDLSA